jgi:IS605 OrfB family transposase
VEKARQPSFYNSVEGIVHWYAGQEGGSVALIEATYWEESPERREEAAPLSDVRCLLCRQSLEGRPFIAWWTGEVWGSDLQVVVGMRLRHSYHLAHKAALALVQAYNTIYREDLQVRNMVKNHHPAKSISDAGWSAFLAILRFKAANAGRTVVAVNPAFTSQNCSGCGVLVQKGLSVRWRSCPQCGTSLRRDHNPAKNIERAGQALQAST